VPEQAPLRVAITGIGAVGPHGVGAPVFWEALLQGRSGIRRFQAPHLQGLPAHAGGEIPDFDPTVFLERRVARRMGRFAQLALASSLEALADAEIGSLEPERTGITIHTGAGGVLEGDREILAKQANPSRTGPLYVPQLSANMAAANVAIHLGVTGPVTAGVGACAAGTIGVAEGMHMIRRGEADVVLAGASDAALTAALVASLANAGALSTSDGEPESISRPFDLDRTGFVPAEGAGMVVLEPLDRALARGAEVYCELAGAAVGCDAYHITSPRPDGAGAELTMRLALARAGSTPDDVACIVAHGTGTRLNDAAEAAAIVRLFEGHREPVVTAPKSAVGHTLGAAGAFGVLVGALCVRHGLVPPTLNYETPDPDCPLAIVSGAPLEAPVGACLVNAFGFGGQNAVLVLRRP
jgi:3-oxoacyl-[acyl-carrier-protein] synthase II